MKETKISHDYACDQLVKSEATEENHEVEKMITQVLESIINHLVLDQVKEIKAMTTEIKWINYKNNVSKYYIMKELKVANEMVELFKEESK